MKTKALVLATLIGLAGCGDDDSPNAPSPPSFRVAGTYSAQWLIQFNRSRDGFNGSFNCFGSMTLAQPTSAANAISGFLVVGSPCPPLTFDLNGTVQPDGSLSFVSGGPRPPEGQCPASSSTQYSGVVTETTFSAHASATLNCPGPGEGEHRFDYILTAWKSS